MSAASGGGADRITSLLMQRYPTVKIEKRAVVQQLWGGYGSIIRLGLSGDDDAPSTVIVKQVNPPLDVSGISHQRKCRSYEVEQCFYENYSSFLDPMCCRVPQLLTSGRSVPGETLFVLEDLDSEEPGGAGFSERRGQLTLQDAQSCVIWLAQFHKTFLGKKPDHEDFGGLWAQGTYWHLATRPDEYDDMDDRDPLKRAAEGIDSLLRNAKHQTLLHGDAKLANFCWLARKMKSSLSGADTKSKSVGGAVAAVDFQYAGWGVGVLDLYYCIGAFPPVENLPRNEDALLDLYFGTLDAGPEVEAEWRALYSVAVADFERFLAGWCGGGTSGIRKGYVGAKVDEALSLLKPQSPTQPAESRQQSNN